MGSERDIWTYDFLVGNKIVHSGFTNNPDRREAEHRLRWPTGHLRIDGAAKTEEGARAWEQSKHKTITPPRRKQG